MIANGTLSRIVLMAALVTLPCLSPRAQALTDAEPGDIDWDEVETTTSFWYVDETTNKPVKWVMKSLFAFFDLIATHVQTDEGWRIYHTHFRYDFGDPGKPTISEADVYWDERFEDCERIGSASNRMNSIAWAFNACSDSDSTQEPPPSAAYGFWSDFDFYMYADDRGGPKLPAQVQAGDFLRYNQQTTLVWEVRDNGAEAYEPDVLVWKSLSSGVYSYTTPSGYEYNTPLKRGSCYFDVDTEKEITEQDWSWDPDYWGGGYTVYPYPDD